MLTWIMIKHRKKKLTILRNCSNKFFGRKFNMVYYNEKKIIKKK